MWLSAFLDEVGVARAEVTLLLHNTTLEPLRSQLAWIAAHRPNLFAAYQSVHNDNVSATLRNRPLVASFVPRRLGRHLFVGLFRIERAEPESRATIYADPVFRELERDFGATDVGPGHARDGGEQRRFYFAKDERMFALEGRIEVQTPLDKNGRPLRSYALRCDRNDPEIIALYPYPVNAPIMPEWTTLVLTPGRLRNLPDDWALRLAGWRGVYLITDQTDGGRYVGAAYGVDNLLNRWRQHVAQQVGITAGLHDRRTENFLFSILELTAPTAQPDEVIAIESNWKTRLHTREWGLNEN